MKKFLTSITFLLLFMASLPGQEPPKGRWSGHASVDMGTNFVKGMSSHKYSNSSGSVSVGGMYSTDKFRIQMDLQGLSEVSSSTVRGQVLDRKNPEAPQMNIDISHKEKSTLDGNAAVQMEYLPDSLNKFSLNLGLMSDRQAPAKAGISIYNTFSGDEYGELVSKCSFDVEEGLMKKSGYNAEAGWIHKFDKPGREIVSGIAWSLERDDNSSVWTIIPASIVDVQTVGEDAGKTDERIDEKIDAEGTPERKYRVTPLKTANRLRASALYCDKDLFDLKSLNLELGADFSTGFENDNLSAANYENGGWVDSLSYREHFEFLTMDLSPKARLSYSPGKFNLSVQLAPDFYVSRLNSDRETGSYNFGRVYVLPDLSADWTPSSKHNLAISYRKGIQRPTYLQICWFQRSGGYANEIQMGNPDLKPASNRRAAISYTFHSGFFTGILEGTGIYKSDNIEKVFNTVNEFRIYTWINSGHSIDNNVKLQMKGEWNNFYAELGGYYNYFIGYNSAGDATRSSDWGMNGSATLKIKGGWTFNAKGRYQSKIIRTYSSITEYIGCDLRVTKEFRKFSVYLQGNDLFDQTIEIGTYSEDKSHVRFEENFYNRRIFSVGASINF